MFNAIPDGYVDLADERRRFYQTNGAEEPGPVHRALGDLYTVFVAAKTEGHAVCLRSVAVQDSSLLSLRVSNEGARVLFGPLVVIERSQAIEQRKRQISTVRDLQGPGGDLLADTIETVLPHCALGSIWLFVRRPKDSLVRTILIDPDNRLCFIHGPDIARGSCKKVTRVFAVPFEPENPISFVVGKVNRIVREGGLSQVRASEEVFQSVVDEVLAMNGSPVFPHQCLSVQYTKVVEDGIELSKVELIEEGLTDSSDIQISSLPESVQIQFLYQVLAHLSTIYPKIHGDLKPANILYRRTLGGDITVRLTDWGFCCNPKKGDRTFVMESGMYGAIGYTAPEVLGQDPSSVDWYKAESWALGCCLYFWLYGRDVPWGSFLQTIYEGMQLGRKPSRSDIERLYETIQAVIVSKKQELFQTYSPFRGKIAQVCFDLLEWNVRERKTSQDILESLGSRGLRLHRRL